MGTTFETTTFLSTSTVNFWLCDTWNLPLCHSPMAKRCDGGQDDRAHAVAEHIGVKASVGKTGAALANCHVTRWVAETGFGVKALGGN